MNEDNYIYFKKEIEGEIFSLLDSISIAPEMFNSRRDSLYKKMLDFMLSQCEDTQRLYYDLGESIKDLEEIETEEDKIIESRLLKAKDYWTKFNESIKNGELKLFEITDKVNECIKSLKAYKELMAKKEGIIQMWYFKRGCL